MKLYFLCFFVVIGFASGNSKSSTSFIDTISIKILFIFPAIPLHNTIEGRIVGGKDARISDFPYQASVLVTKDWNLCGATIISEKYVLTAAHCVERGQNIGFLVAAGTQTRVVDSNMQMRNVTRVIVHESYNRPVNSHDIAILVLDEALVFNEFIQSAKLPQQDEVLTAGTPVYISGFGKETEGILPPPNNLKFAVIPTWSGESCEAAYRGRITEDMMCAGDGRKDSCQGDSGGPMVFNKTLYGIISWGEGCARPESPGVYARVSHFVDWIQSKIDL